MTLETAAMYWLRFEKRVQIVTFERTPRRLFGSRPDVLGVTAGRHLIEVECKRSRQDFSNDAKKPHIRQRQSVIRLHPKFFYYMMPVEISEGVKVPEWAGLLTLRDNVVVVVKPAPANPEAKRLSVAECCRLALLVSNHVIRAEMAVDAWRHSWDQQPRGLEYQI